MSQDNDALFSRSLAPSPFGKCTERMDIPAPEILNEAAITLGAVTRPRSMSKAEYVRTLCERAIFGEMAVIRATQRNLSLDPREADFGSLDEAITALAMLNGMGRDEYVTHLLKRAVFGEYSMIRSMGEKLDAVNGANVG